MIASAAAEAIDERGRFMIALAGGSTPEKTYSLLADQSTSFPIDWKRCRLFFGDERDVPSDDPRSNFGMAKRCLIDKVPVAAEDVYPMVTKSGDPASAAAGYAAVLANAFGSSEPPRFDVIMLGVGDDGHCASLFPESSSLDITDRWVVSNPPGVLPPPVERVSLTFPAINAARQVLFLVAGERKAEAVQDIFECDAPVSRRPSAGVRPVDGIAVWLLDKGAACRLADHG